MSQTETKAILAALVRMIDGVRKNEMDINLAYEIAQAMFLSAGGDIEDLKNEIAGLTKKDRG
jgi:hypothetical protein